MTTIAYAATIGVQNKQSGDGRFFVSTNVNPDPKASSATLTTDAASLATHNTSATGHATTMAAAMATLVADGASPTQAHVTTANTAYTALATDLTHMGTDSGNITTDAANVAGGVAGDVVLSINIANCPSINALKSALAGLLSQVRASGALPEA